MNTKTIDLGFPVARVSFDKDGVPYRLELFTPPDGGPVPAQCVSITSKEMIARLIDALNGKE